MRRSFIRGIALLALVVSVPINTFAQDVPTDANSREVTLYNAPEDTPWDAVSREVSLYNALVETPWDAVSREVSLYISTPEDTPWDAVSREVSLYNAPVETPWDAVSREVTVWIPPAGPPETAITNGPDENGLVCGNDATFCFLGGDDQTPPDAMRFVWRMDGNAWSDFTYTTCATPSGLSPGLHTFEVAAVDSGNSMDPSPARRTFTVSADPLVISAVQPHPDMNWCTITWNTNRPTTSQVEFGRTTGYGTITTEEPTPTSAHSVTLNGLTAGLTYHFRVRSRDGEGCLGISADGVFATPTTSPVNLSLSDLTVSPTETVPLANVFVTYLVTNTGNAEAVGPWTDTFYISPIATLDGQSEQMLRSLEIDGPLPPQGTSERMVNAQIPLLPPGNYYIHVLVNAAGSLVETNWADNTIAKPIACLKITGLVAAPGQVPMTLDVGTPVADEVLLTSLVSSQLTGIGYTVEDLPDNVRLEMSLPATLEPYAPLPASFTVTALNESTSNGSLSLEAHPVVRFQSVEGFAADVQLDLSIRPRYPRLVATPEKLTSGMLRGGQTFVQAEITNTGGVTANNVTVLLPNASWMSLVTPTSLGNLAPGASASITLSLMPSASLPLGPYIGSFAVNATHALNGISLGTSVAFSFNCVSSNKGDLRVVAGDEYTFHADDHPPVSGASVTLRDPQTGTSVAEGITNEEGVLQISGIPEGSYEIRVSADKHTDYVRPARVVAGQEQFVQAFLPRDLVTYRWLVWPTDIPDKYEVTLHAIFETHVPAPVVTIEPAYVDMNKLPYDASGDAVVNYTITNHGLIAAQNCRFFFDEQNTFDVDVSVSDLGTLPAKTSVVVPVRYRRRTTALRSIDLCQFGGHLPYLDICGIVLESEARTVNYVAPCPWGSLPVGARGGGGGGGGGDVWILNPKGEIRNNDPCCLLECVWSFIPYSWALDPKNNCYRAYFTGNAKCAIDILDENPDAFNDCLWRNAKSLVTCSKAARIKLPSISKVIPFIDCGMRIKDCIDALNPAPQHTKQAAGTAGYLAEQAVRLRILESAMAERFGDTKWLAWSENDADTFYTWFDTYLYFVTPESSSGRSISASEREALLALILPSNLRSDDAVRMIDRWNRTMDYYAAGIYTEADVPAGQSHEFIDFERWKAEWVAAGQVMELYDAEDMPGIFDGVVSAWDKIIYDIAHKEEGICARVKLQLDQDVTLTRSAFKARLDVINSLQNVELQQLSVSLFITDESGADASHLFGVSSPMLEGTADVTGHGFVAPGTTASAVWTIVPTRDAAPVVDTVYTVSGSFSYLENDRLMTVHLVPAPVLVKPDPLLELRYFWQRDVYSDDPWTEEVEPAEPFSLGLLVVNNGNGSARSMQIASSQPEIIENEKGLLVDFGIIGSRVNDQPVAPSLNVDLGDIMPGSTATAEWKMTSSLQGKFIYYSASFQHVDDLGNPRTSLIDSVDIHELEHVVRVVDPTDDGKPDFLANDVPDRYDLPDRLWISDGTNALVAPTTNAVVDRPVSFNQLQTRLSAAVASNGFIYIRADDPGRADFHLVSVVRSDGKVIRLGDNAWTTHRWIRLVGQTPYMQYRIHIFDKDSTGSYTLNYVSLADLPSPTLSAVTPAWAFAGSSGVTLTLTGTGFLPGSTTRWNGEALSTAYVAPDRLFSTVTSEKVATAGTAAIHVENPYSAGGRISNTIPFQVVTCSVSLSPNPPRTGDLLTASVTMPQEQGLILKYAWQRNGATLAEETTTSLDLSRIGNGDRGDTITVVVTPIYSGELGAAITASVSVANTAPLAADRHYNLTHGERTSADLAGSDGDQDQLTYTIVTPPVQGVLSGTPPALTYQREPGYTGTDRFTYICIDGGGLVSNVAEVVINVTSPPAVFSTPHGDGLRGLSSAVVAARPEIKWQIPLPQGIGYGGVTFSDGGQYLYLKTYGGAQGQVYKINAADGSVVWSTDPAVIGFGLESQCAVTVDETAGRLYTAGNDRSLPSDEAFVVCLDMASGQIIWQTMQSQMVPMQTMMGDGFVLLSPDGQTLYLRDCYDHVAALRTIDGSLKWVFQSTPTSAQWSVGQTLGPVWTDQASGKTLLAVSSNTVSGSVTVLQDNGTAAVPLWSRSLAKGLEFRWWGHVAANQDYTRLYVNSFCDNDNPVFTTLDAMTGETVWQVPYSTSTPYDLFPPPCVGADGTIYAAGWVDRPQDKGGLVAWDPDGTHKWTFETGGSEVNGWPVTTAGRMIYVVDEPYHKPPYLYAIRDDETKSTLLWTMELPWADNSTHSFYTPIVGPDGTVYIAPSAPTIETQTLYALVPEQSTRLRFKTQPGNASVGQPLPTEPVVSIVDANDNVITSFTGPISISIQPGSGTAGATLSGMRTAYAMNGVASFVGLSIDKGGTDYVLLARAPGAPNAASTSFHVTTPVVRVATSGSDSNDGSSWSLAKRSIRAALHQAEGPSGEVWVKAGTYIECVTIPADIALYGGFRGTETGRDQRNSKVNVSVLDGSGSPGTPGVTCDTGNSLLDGFVLRNANVGVAVSGTAILSSNTITGTNCGVAIWGTATLSNNDIYDNVSGVEIQGGTAALFDNRVSANSHSGVRGLGGKITIIGNTISGSSNGVYVDSGAMADLFGNTISANNFGVFYLQAGNTDITGNTIAGNGVGLIIANSPANVSRNTISGNIFAFIYDGCGFVNGGTGNLCSPMAISNNIIARNERGLDLYTGIARVTNNTFTGNDYYGIHIEDDCSASLSNNIVAFNYSFGIVKRFYGIISVFSHNDVYGNITGDYSGFTPSEDQGDISLNPLFFEWDRNDYHLLAGSPCIEWGDDAFVSLGETDLDGKPRIVGAHVDIGAYENQTQEVYQWSDVIAAMRVAAGILPGSSDSMNRLNPDQNDIVDLTDVTLLLRRVWEMN